MKICVAQTKPVKGDVLQNVERHKRLIDLAVSHKAELIIFPELSLTGYEPGLAKELATSPNDNRLDVFQEMSDTKKIVIGVGMPLQNNSGINISLILFQPDRPKQIYSKKYLHSDEEAFFVSGVNFPILKVNQIKMALAICYEISIPDHAADAKKHGAEIYLASVAKSAQGIEQATKQLSGIAKKYSMPVLMSNCTGPSDDFVSAGNTSAWNRDGVLVGQLNGSDEGVLMIDTGTGEIVEETI